MGIAPVRFPSAWRFTAALSRCGLSIGINTARQVCGKSTVVDIPVNPKTALLTRQGGESKRDCEQKDENGGLVNSTGLCNRRVNGRCNWTDEPRYIAATQPRSGHQ